MPPDGPVLSSQITAERLTSLFRPRSVALVGASDKSTFSVLAYRNLVEFGFGERTYLVNRRGAETHGQPTVTSCARIGEPVDLAYLMVPQAGMLEALDDAAAAGIRNACVLSAGYAEAGEAGRAAQAELVRHAAGLGMVLLGPNHLGFANFTDGVPVCSIPELPRVPGPVALLSQSGASSSAMLDFARMVNVGLSYLVTLSNVAWWSEAARTPDAVPAPEPVPVPPPGQRRGKWSEHAARTLLSNAGIPVVPARLAGSADEAVKAAADLGGPLAVKLASADVLHKSDIGGVRLDVPPDEDAVRAAYQAVNAAAPAGARVDGVLISPMRRGGTELLVGVVRDPQWGPVLAVAIGGLFVEVLQDSALAPLPVTPGQSPAGPAARPGRADGARGAPPPIVPP